jgi:acetylcholinesterase
MLFGTSGIARGDSTLFELAVSHSMQDMYLAFITDGPAGLETKGWKAYTPNGAVLEFGKGDAVVGNLAMESFEEVCDGIEPVAGSVPPM